MIEFVTTGTISLKTAYIHPIWSDTNLHPIQNKLSLIYIYGIECGREFIINLHNIDNDTTTLNSVSFDFEKSLIFDKKSLMNVFQLNNSYDADMLVYLQTNNQLRKYTTPAHTHFYRKFSNLKWVNDLVPITKHIELIREIKNEFIKHYKSVSGVLEKFDNFYIEQLHILEKNGIWTTNGMEWTQYHPYTITSRPSNNFNGINYAALNKKDNSRDRFISRFEGGKLVQFDYDGYHPRIISKMINYHIPIDVSVHHLLADMYGTDYSDSKAITFRQLYGGVEPQYLQIPFFKSVSNYIDNLWIAFNRAGYIETPMGRKLFKHNLTDVNYNKLFNYLLQATETELNMKILKNINLFLDNLKSKIVLYTYDSYLFDIHPNEINVLKDLKILIEGNGFPTKVEAGDCYSNLSVIKI